MADPTDLEFDLRVTTAGEVTVVAVDGDLDIVSADETSAALKRAQTQGATVVLDLRALRFMDSSGLRIVLEANRRASDTGGRLQVAPGDAGVRRVFELSGVGALVETIDAPPEGET